MDILLIILGILCLIVGLAGCILPMIPGPPVAYAGLLLLHFTDKAQFSTTQLLLWLAAVVLVQILDYFCLLYTSNSFLLQLHIGQIHISSQLFITPRSFQIKGYFHLSILF